MNWQNITIEKNFIKQETNLHGVNAVNYIPLNHIDSFGIIRSENKIWLYLAAFFGLCSFIMVTMEQSQSMVLLGMVSLAFIFAYFFTRRTSLNISSNRATFSVLVRTTKDEINAVNEFVIKIKESIQSEDTKVIKVA